MRAIAIMGSEGEEVAALDLLPDGSMTYDGPDSLDPRKDGCFNPDLPSRPADWNYPEQGRAVQPSEGELFLETLVAWGGSMMGRWTPDEDLPDEDEEPVAV